MTYQQKREELQHLFSQKFEAYAKAKQEMLPQDPPSEKFLIVKREFEKVNINFQNFLILFKDGNASFNDEYGSVEERCDVAK